MPTAGPAAAKMRDYIDSPAPICYIPSYSRFFPLVKPRLRGHWTRSHRAYAKTIIGPLSFGGWVVALGGVCGWLLILIERRYCIIFLVP